MSALRCRVYGDSVRGLREKFAVGQLAGAAEAGKLKADQEILKWVSSERTNDLNLSA